MLPYILTRREGISKYTPGTAGGPGRDRTLAVKRRKKARKSAFFLKKIKLPKYTPGTAGGPGGRDRTLAVKSRKTANKITFFFRKKINFTPQKYFFLHISSSYAKILGEKLFLFWQPEVWRQNVLPKRGILEQQMTQKGL